MSAADAGPPALLLRAARPADAARALSELIDNDVTEEQAGGGGGGGGAPPYRVWRLLNKYYRADVRVYPVCDPAAGDASDPPVPQHCIEALVIYLAEDECTAEALARRAEGWGEAGAVRVAACEAARAPAALRAAAAARRLELVALREPRAPAGAAEPLAELYGWERVRGALHAHTWRGLQRLDGAPHRPPPEEAEPAGGEEEQEEEEEPDDEVMLQRAEQFAALLGALPAARAGGGGGGGGGGAGGDDDEERLRRAEALVAAFCRALGDPAPSGW